MSSSFTQDKTQSLLIRNLYRRGIQLTLYFFLIGSLTLIHTYSYAQEKTAPVLKTDSVQLSQRNPGDSIVIERMKMKWLKVAAVTALPASLPFVLQGPPISSNAAAALPAAKMPAPPTGGGGGSGGGGSGNTNPPPAPSTSFSFTHYCGSTRVKRNSNPSYDVEWYWQTSSGGTSTAYPANSFTVTSSRYMYLKALSLFNNKWSGYKAVYVPLNKPIPSTPAVVSVSNQCGKSVLTRPNPPSGVTYYWQSSPSGTSTSNSSSKLTRTSGSRYYLRARHSGGCWSGSRTVNYSIKSVPSTPGTISVSNQCGKSVLTRPNPPSGVTYYWQSSSSGTSTSNSSSTKTRTSGSTYYLRARNNSSGCWSSTRSVSYSIKSVPSTPASPSTTNNCGNTVLTRSSPPSGVTWYWQSSSSGTSTSNSSSSITRTSGSVYYLRARNNTSGCWSGSRSVPYSINSIPSVPSAVSISNQCDQSVLTRSNPPSGFTYYWQSSSSGTSTSNTSSSITLTSGSSYYLRARNNSTGCWSSARIISYSINSIPSVPSSITATNNCGNTVLTRSTPPSGITWYWQSSSTGTSISNSSTSVTRTSGTNYYLRARNNATECWSNGSRAISYEVFEDPVTPSNITITKNCGSTVLSYGAVPTGETWYWQSTNTGTDTNESSPSVSFSSGDIYYLRSKLNAFDCWSTAAAINYTIDAVPELASGDHVNICNSGIANLTANPGNFGNTVRWYDAPIEGNLLDEALSFTTTNLTNSTTFYAASYNTETLCEDSERHPITATVTHLGTATGSGNSRCGSGSITLTASEGTGGDDIQWFANESSDIPFYTGAELVLTDLSVTTTYFAATFNSTTGCADDERTAITAVVYPLPVDYAVTGGNHCTDDGALILGLSDSEIGTIYQLNFNGSPIPAVTKEGTGAAITFDTSQSAVGSYTVTATNANCSLTMGGAATIIQSPQRPIVSGGGAYCAGGTGLTVDLSFAEAGATYELFKDGISTTQTITSTSFENQLEGGLYAVKATKDGCPADLTETVQIIVHPQPVLPQFDLSSNLCGDKTLSVLNPPLEGGTDSWTWQGEIVDGFESTVLNSHTLTSTGNYYVRSHESVNGCWSDPVEIAVTVNPFPAAPATIFTETNNCGNTEIARDSGSEAGWTWYWQVSEFDEDTANAEASIVQTSGSNIYLRSRSDAGCWSPAENYGYSINAIPAEPVVVVDVLNECGKSTLTPQTVAPAGYTWYWQETSDDTNNTILSAEVERTSGTEYFLRAQDDNNACWSAAKLVTYEIKTVAEQPSILAPVKSCGSTELTMTTVPAGETWYWQSDLNGTDQVNNDLSVQKIDGDTYYLRSINNTSECWSETKTGNYAIDEIPIVLQPTVENLCGETKLVKPTDQSGITYRWEAASGQSLPEGVSGTTASFRMEIYKPIRIRATDQSTACTDISDVTYTITPIPYVKSSNDKNFVMAVSVQEEGVKTDVNIGCYKNQIKVDYFDGLGRALQTVIPNGSPLEHDIVQAYVYDAYGRQEKEYLPYAKSTTKPGAYRANAVTEQANFYSSSTSKVAQDQKPWIQHQFEQSPLNRVLQTYGAGEEWQGTGETPSGKSTQFATLTNEEDVVIKWKINETTVLPVRNDYYAANELLLQEIVTDATENDAQDQVIHEYTDSRGLTILKRVKIDTDDWLDTYYLYDDWGSVVMVLPPVLSDITSPTLTDVKELAFIYQYDEKRRMQSKKLPGTGAEEFTASKVSELPGWHEIIYDEWDRIVMTQDPNLVENKDYLVTKYDALNRPIITGLFKSTKTADHWRTNLVPGGRFESRQNNEMGYSDNTSPSLNEIYTVTYYDDYAFIGYSGWNPLGNDFSFKSETGFSDSKFDKVKGQTTGSKVKVLGADTDTWLNTVTYYDDKYRVLQTITENIRGGVERTTFEYDFAGKVLMSLHTQTSDSDVSVIVLKEFEYDKAGRLLKTWHSVNSQEPVLMAENHYNEAGELVEKNLHSENDGTDFMQSVDYRYNIRGWLTHINNSTLSEDPATNDDSDDLFGMQLAYTANPTVNGHAILPRYDGNISSILWKTDNHVDAPKEQIFGYDYDLANRLKTARYASGTSDNWTEDAGHYDVEIGSYDKNGNIQSLKRQGNGDLLDDLTYGYKNGGISNQLDAVSEGELADDQLGFTEKYTLDDEYDYDANGNMIADLNKGITPIVYNHLNLPIEVDWGGGKKIKFQYDATGIKLHKEVYEAGNSVPVSTIDYTAMGQFQDDELEFIFTDEGRALKTPNGFDYEYFLKDHLGNNRVAFGMLTEVDYYQATMEDEDADTLDDEQEQFNNVSTTRFTFEEYNRTPVSAKLQWPDKIAKVLNGVGPSKVLSVKQGDKIEVSVYGGYPVADAGNGVPVGEFAAAVAGSFGITAGGETQQLFEAFENFAPLAGAAGAGEETRPRGYLNIIIFDEDLTEEPQYAMKEISMTDGYQSMELLERELTAAFDGTAYIYVANESSASTADIYFDELSITHTKSAKSLQVTQSSDFYPFGMKMQPASYQHQGHNVNKYTYNGKEEQKETRWYDYGARMYQPDLGRFFTQDRFSEKYYGLNPYQYGANNPILFIDINGDSLDINNVHSSLEDLRSLVKTKNQFRVTAEENGRVSIDLSGLSEKRIKKDKGLLLLSEISSNSEVNMLYTSAEIEEFGNSLIVVGLDPNGVVNASNKGKDSAGQHTVLPQNGYDSQLAVSLYGTWDISSGDGRRSVIFHELSENYNRALGIDYNSNSDAVGAHQKAANREGSSFGNSQPGSIIRYNKPKYSPSQKSAYNYILKNWEKLK